MSTLSNAQAALLTAAVAAPDGAIDREGDHRTIASLIKKGFLIALPHAEGEGRLLITEAGRQAHIAVSMAADEGGHGEGGAHCGEPGGELAITGDSASGPGAAPAAPAAPATPGIIPDPTREPAAEPQLPKGKIGALIALLRQPAGATVETMMEATGWQAHSVRGAMSGAIKKNLGLEIASEKTDAGRLYRIKSEAGA